MDNLFMFPILSNFGVAGLIFAAFMVLLRWVLKQQAKLLDDAKEERQIWQKMVDAQKDALITHTHAAREYHNSVREANSI